MSHELREEIHQKRAFHSLEQEAFLNLVRTYSVVTGALEQVLKAEAITLAQYNVLRILRGAEPAGLCRNAVRDRMVTRMPDMTRLLDRMEAAGLVSRCRDGADRRHVTTRLTPRATALLQKLDDVVDGEHRRALGHMSPGELQALIGLLTRVREST